MNITLWAVVGLLATLGACLFNPSYIWLAALFGLVWVIRFTRFLFS